MVSRDGISLPGWFVRVVTIAAGVAITMGGAAIPWAWSIDRAMTRIETRLEGLDRMWGQEIAEIKRRLDRLEK